MSDKDLLVEIGTEELPPKALKSLGLAFKSGVENGLGAEDLAFSGISWFATPRRLAVLVEGLAESQPDRNIEKYGPALKAALDAEGKPTKAAQGFARSCNTAVEDLDKGEKDGVPKLLYRSLQKGKKTEALVEKIVANSLNKLPIPKRMRWGSNRIEFVRPVHWVVLLYGEKVIPATILGKLAGNLTFGHRFHQPSALVISRPSEYAGLLEEKGYVIADFEARRKRVRDLVEAEAAKLNATVVIENALLDEVTSLVEWPVALTGGFDQHFLRVPKEALISSLTSHQKCFHLVADDGRLLPNFVAVSNLDSKDPAQVIEGNERVIRPRLADADFFFQTDKNESLASRQERLKQVVFQQKLGTLHAKSRRVASLARSIAAQLGAREALCERAALLAKCDLLTSMVGEFAELQGIMGYYYALNDGEDPEVAAAINEQYMPRHAGDELPESLTGSIVSLAEKIDTMVGLFVIGQPPTGSRDPFALRRAAIGILRILVEKQLDLDLRSLIDLSVKQFAHLDPGTEIAGQVFEFFLERFRFWYQEKGIPAEVYLAVLSLQPPRPLDFNSRILAVDHFGKLDEAKALASANKRVANLLRDIDDDPSVFSVDDKLLTEPAEQALAAAIESKESEVAPLFQQRDYRQGLAQLAELKAPVDRFFDEVLVMDEELSRRNNRLALLVRLRALFLQVADISLLHQG